MVNKDKKQDVKTKWEVYNIKQKTSSNIMAAVIILI